MQKRAGAGIPKLKFSVFLQRLTAGLLHVYLKMSQKRSIFCKLQKKFLITIIKARSG